MDGLEAEAYDRKYTDRALIARILDYFRPHRRLMLAVALLVILNALVDTAFPLLVSRGLDLVIASRTLQTVLVLIVAILGASVLSWTFTFFRQRFTARSVGDVVLCLRNDAFASVIANDMSFYDQFLGGKIVSRITSDTEDFATVVTLTLNLLSQFLLFFLLAAILFFRSVYLALLALSIVPAIVLVALTFRLIARRATRRSQRSLARVNANVQEVVSGIAVAKNFRQEQHMYDEFMRVNAQSYRVSVRSGFIYSGVFPLLFFIANLGTTVVVYFGGRSVFGHTISAGDWFLFVQSMGLLWFPLTSIASFWSQFQLGLSASERVFALLDTEPQVRQIASEPVEQLRGKIEFRHLFFSYDDRQHVLTDFHLTVQPGETVALVGHTGAGKSSLARLIARFYEYQGGELLIDDRDIRRFDLYSYHRQLGIVPQSPFLFSGTVTDNIRYARPQASDEDVERVARSIGYGDWLEALPEGLNTLVGESGRALSMGQRQLVALARVLLQDPAMVILDEATASVDPLTEAQIQEGLDVVLKGRTAILIAHRLSTIRHANRILLLANGRIIEEGTHDDLLQRGGHYAHLYNTYFRHQSANYRPGEGFIAVLDGSEAQMVALVSEEMPTAWQNS
jgi:ABC-type multidrug transport system fused ATPase/permease subunit